MTITPNRCSSCGMEFIQPKSVGNSGDRVPPPQIGDLLLCGACGVPSKITLEGTAPLTEAEFASLTDDERSDLEFAQRAILSHLRNQ